MITGLTSPTLRVRSRIEGGVPLLRWISLSHWGSTGLQVELGTLLRRNQIREGELPEQTFADDEQQYGGMMRSRRQRLALVASAKVTVTTNAPSPPVKLELHPWFDPAKSP